MDVYHGAMAALTPDQAVEAAQQAEQTRLEAIRRLAEARQEIQETIENAKQQRADLESRLQIRTREAEQAARLAWKAALKAGWTPAELRKIGFPVPARKATSRRHTGRSQETRKRQQEADLDGSHTVQDERPPVD